MTQHKILINGEWRAADSVGQFQAFNPTSGESLSDIYPVSSWADCDAALDAAKQAFEAMQKLHRSDIANCLNIYADLIESNSSALVEMAHLETGLAITPRLKEVEIPRTLLQLRLAAKAAKEASWSMPTIDTQNNIRSMLQAVGPVAIFGPNNFPFAFGSISGGDFAAAIAAGNPIIAKAHPSHPATTRLFAELAFEATQKAGLPAAAVQLIYAMENDSGLKLVSDPRIAATGFTGSRNAGLALKKEAEEAGKLIYLELSSLNPVVVLAGALDEKLESISDEFSGSCMMAAGQFCTKPGLIIVPSGETGDRFVSAVTEKLNHGVVGTLLSDNAAQNIAEAISHLVESGATLLTEKLDDQSHDSPANSATTRFCHPNTLMTISGSRFVKLSETFQREIFGNASLVIRSDNSQQTLDILACLEGNLTGCIYSHSDGLDDKEYELIEPLLRSKVGRLINDKMPTGVAVSSAMNHGGPFPSSGHPGFSAVGLPGSIKRFSALKCFDNVRLHRLPDILADENPDEKIWRLIDGRWTVASI